VRIKGKESLSGIERRPMMESAYPILAGYESKHQYGSFKKNQAQLRYIELKTAIGKVGIRQKGEEDIERRGRNADGPTRCRDIPNHRMCKQFPGTRGLALRFGGPLDITNWYVAC
jgi:hypothetical protein